MVEVHEWKASPQNGEVGVPEHLMQFRVRNELFPLVVANIVGSLSDLVMSPPYHGVRHLPPFPNLDYENFASWASEVRVNDIRWRATEISVHVSGLRRQSVLVSEESSFDGVGLVVDSDDEIPSPSVCQ